MKPHYIQWCAEHCTDKQGRPRVGTVWVHMYGRTEWVCEPCSNQLGNAAGLGKPRQRTTADATPALPGS